MLLPDPRALPYVGDAKWLGKVRQVAAAKFRDDKIDISDCGAKVKKLIEDAITAEGIQILVKQVSLFTPEFEEKLKALKSPEAKASEMEHAIRNEIHVKLDENPLFYTSLRDRLERIILDRKASRIDAAQQLKLFEDLRKDLQNHAQAAEKVGLSETGFAIYGILVQPDPLKVAEPAGPAYGQVDDAKKELASLLEEALESQMALVDWTQKDDVQREMRKRIKRQLRAAGYPDGKLDPMAESLVDLLKRRRTT
jgi:type I restriction enzyme, R subunit